MKCYINGSEHVVKGKKETCLNSVRIAARKCCLHSRRFY